jgi:hypothetical protein
MDQSFFGTVLNAGAILAGFCGTFLSFRIQREANYYRQPSLDFELGEAKDIYIGLTHFTSSFLLLGLATVCSMIFGLVIPLLALGGSAWAISQQHLVIGGLIGTLILLVAYFVTELIHYQILKANLLNDLGEWKREFWFAVISIFFAVFVTMLIYFSLPRT